VLIFPVENILGLWCLMPLQQYFSYIVAVIFYWLRKPEHPEKTTDLSQVKKMQLM